MKVLGKVRMLDRTQLKLIAFITMVIDHVGFVFFPYGTFLYRMFRFIGRTAFPLFLCLFVEGFLRSRHRERNFAILCGAAVASEYWADKLFVTYGLPLTLRMAWMEQSVLVTLVLVTLYLYGLVFIMKQSEKWQVAIAVMLIWTLLCSLAADFCNVDYSDCAIYCAGFAFLALGGFAPIGIKPNDRMGQSGFFWAVVLCALLEFFVTHRPGVFLALIPAACYDADRIPKLKFRWLFYAGYPLHLCLLYVLAYVL